MHQVTRRRSKPTKLRLQCSHLVSIPAHFSTQLRRLPLLSALLLLAKTPIVGALILLYQAKFRLSSACTTSTSVRHHQQNA
jgi:hypothetical protein